MSRTVPKSDIFKFVMENEQAVYKMVYSKYTILKIRLKISFMAFQQSKTVKDLFISAIIKTYQHFINEGFIEDNYNQFEANSIIERFFSLKTVDFLDVEARINQNKENGIDEITPELQDFIELKVK